MRPGETIGNQINRLNKNLGLKTLDLANTDADHYMVVAKYKEIINTTNTYHKKKIRCNLKKLENEIGKEKYEDGKENRMEVNESTSHRREMNIHLRMYTENSGRTNELITSKIYK